MVCELGDLSSEDKEWETFERLELDNYVPDVTQNVDRACISRQGKIHCYRLLIKPPCECDVCTLQFRTQFFQRRWVFGYTKALLDSEAREEAATFVRDLHENLQYLKQQCEESGNTILKRWKKKSSEKRKALLLEVDPEMYPHQWSDIHFTKDFEPTIRAGADDSWRDPDITQGRARRPYRNVCMLPYITLESLKDDPARLLNILYNRVKYSPQQWAPYDNYLLDKQWKIGSFATVYNGSGIVMDGPDYGKLTPWNQKSAHAGEILGFPRAILLLEAQWRLSCLLKAFVEKLLHGSEQPKSSSTLNQSLSPGLKKATDKSSCVEFASVYLNQPFAAPPAFDIQSLLAISQAQVNLHGDHLWLLQTDPLSLRRYAHLVLDGGLVENLTLRNQYTTTALKLMEDAMTYWTWEWIHETLLDLKDLYLKHQGKIQPGKPLPPDYERSIGCLEALLIDLIQRRARQTLSLLPTRPGLREKWNVQYVQRLQTMVMLPKRKDTEESFYELFFNDRLDFCLSGLVAMIVSTETVDGEGEYLDHEPSELFAILDDYLSTGSKPEKKADIARLDEVLYNSYSVLSALHQLLFMVRLHRPRVQVPALEQAKEMGTGKAWRYTRAGYLDQDHRQFDHKLNTECPDEKIKAQQTLGTLMGKFLETTRPSGSRATQKWLDQDEAQRSACARLWAQMRSRHRQTLERIKIGREDIEADLKILSADLAPEHLASIQAERAEILAKIAAKKSQNAAKKNPTKSADIQTHWNSETQADNSIQMREPKVKIKTRSDKVLEQVDLAVKEMELADPEPPQVKVGVSKRALEILQSLFPKGNFEERTKSVDWASFVLAMAEAGFVARQTHGSEYSFEPIPTCEWYGRGKIVFHKPHPEPKYEAWKLLGIGKRMGKWFDWTPDTFCLANTGA